MISLQICRNSVAELRADPRSPVSWTPALAGSRSCLIPPSQPGHGRGALSLPVPRSTALWVLSTTVGAGGRWERWGGVPRPRVGQPARSAWSGGSRDVGWGPWEGAGRDGQHATEGSFGSSLSWNEFKITVGKCTSSLYDLREALAPPGLSLPTYVVNTMALQEDLGRWIFFMAKRMKNWGILSRDVVHSPSFEVFHQGWSPYQKNMFYFISKGSCKKYTGKLFICHEGGTDEMIAGVCSV